MRVDGVRPIGLDVAHTGRLLQRAFDETLTSAGGSLPTWLILMTLKRGDHPRQSDIAAAIGIEGATLTHHLHRMERDGLVSRYREPTNRRNQVVTLTPKGRRLFEKLLATVIAFDERLRQGLTTREVTKLGELLGRLRTNISD
jgi:MarR family transcriptional regulator for hemolysin